MGFLSRHRKRIAIILAALYGSYLVGTGLIIPAVAKHLAPQELEELLGREVSLEKLRFNPFTLALTAENFVLHSHSDTPLFEFKRFYANFELSSLWRRSIHFKFIELAGAQGSIQQLSKGKFDIDDLLALADSAEPESEVSEETSAELVLPALSVDLLKIEDAGFQITDHSRKGAPRLHITPVSFEITHLSTQPTEEGGNHYEFHAASPSGGSLAWLGQLTFAPLTLEGNLTLDQVALSPFADFFNEFIAAKLTSGVLSLSNNYHLSYDEKIRLSLSKGNLSLRDITLLDGLGSDTDNTLLKLHSFNLEDFSLDTLSSKIYAKALTLDSPHILADLANDGTINWLEAVSPIEQTAVETSEEQSTANTDAAEASLTAQDPDLNSSTEWQLLAEQFHLKNGAIQLKDNSNANAGLLSVNSIDLLVKNIQWPSINPTVVALNAELENGGKLSLNTEGTLSPLAFSGDLALKELTLESINPWISQQLPLQLDSGNATIQQTFELSLNDSDELNVSATGRAQVDKLSLREIGKRTIASWQSVAVESTKFNLSKQEISIGKVLVNGLHSGLMIGADGSSWLDIFASDTSESSTSANNSQPDWRVVINEIELQNNQLSYHDGTMSPSFQVSLDKLSGKLTNIDTAGKQQSSFNFTAQVDGNAPLAIKGKGYLLDEPLNIELSTQLNDYEMTRLSPFTGSFLGFLTESGQLTLDSQLEIKNNLLNTSNKVLAKRFYLGDRVESPDAISAPIKLGLSVLRDRRENINLPVVAKGDLADPSVSVSRIILNTFTNILVRAATSPFSVLMGLGGDSSLEYLAYMPGTTQLDANSEAMVTTLAQALIDRPKLRLTLTGSAALPDQRAIATNLVGEELMGRQWTNLTEALEEDKFRKKTLRAWEKLTHEEELLGSEREQAEAAFEQLVQIKIQQLDEGALLTLANQRADQLKALLVSEHGLEGSSITVANSIISHDEEAGVKLEMSSR